MTAKGLLEAALKLAPKSREKIALKLLESLGGDDLRGSLREGAKLARDRFKAIDAGTMGTVSEEEVERALLGGER